MKPGPLTCSHNTSASSKTWLDEAEHDKVSSYYYLHKDVLLKDQSLIFYTRTSVFDVASVQVKSNAAERNIACSPNTKGSLVIRRQAAAANKPRSMEDGSPADCISALSGIRKPQSFSWTPPLPPVWSFESFVPFTNTLHRSERGWPWTLKAFLRLTFFLTEWTWSWRQRWNVRRVLAV